MTQAARADGSGNAIVQVRGDGNTVVAGLPHLALTRSRGLHREVRTDPDTGRPHAIDILRPFARAIPMVGRARETQALGDWLRLDRPVSVRVLTGDAGIGKTRLALELVEEAAAEGWRAGFLTRAELGRFRRQHSVAEWGWNAPTLAVVDYAAASAKELAGWLRELAENPAWEDGGAGRVRPFRLLLLERSAAGGKGWWAEAFGQGADAAVTERMADPPEPVALAPLDDPGDRRAALAGALEALETGLSLPAAGEDPEFDRRLAGTAWAGAPLMLAIAAATAARSGLAGVLAMGEVELARIVAETELARIRRVAPGRGAPAGLAPLLDHAAAVATLCEGLTADEARAAIAREAEALGYALPAGPAALRDALAVAMPDGAGGLAPVEPDFVGEALLLAVWGGKEHAGPAIARAHGQKPGAVMHTVLRACQDYPVRGRREPLDWLTVVREERSGDLQALVEMANALPERTVELREFAAGLTEEIVSALRPLAATDPDAFRPNLAASLNNLSNRLSDLGDHGPALEAIREAVAVYRELAADRPDAFRPDLAGSLNNLSVHLSALGDREAALEAIREAVVIRRELAAERPDAFRPDLAGSLNNLSVRLSALGDREAALEAIREAVAVYRELAADRPDAFRPDLAMSLNNLSNRLSGLGDREAALEAIREAVAIRRELAAERPDAFRPDLAASLNNLSGDLSNLGEHEAALEAIREAVAIRRELAVERPDAFRPDLATSLNNQSVHLSNLGEHEAALEAIREAVAIRRELAVERPDAFRPDLAASLNNLSVHLSGLGDREAALEAIREAVAVYRELVAERPDAFRPDLAMSLNNLSVRLSDLGDREAALEAIREAVAIRRELAVERPDAFRPDLAASLNNLSVRLSGLGDREAALEAIREAVRTLEAPFLALPQGHAEHMRVILDTYGSVCEASGQQPDAALVEPIVEALARLRNSDEQSE